MDIFAEEPSATSPLVSHQIIAFMTLRMKDRRYKRPRSLSGINALPFVNTRFEVKFMHSTC